MLSGMVQGCCLFWSLQVHVRDFLWYKLLAHGAGGGLQWTVLLILCESTLHFVGRESVGPRGPKILQNFASNHSCV